MLLERVGQLLLPVPAKLLMRNGGDLLRADSGLAGTEDCCCETYPCGNCTNAPLSVTLTVSGITNSVCTDCTTLNGTFVCNFNFALSCPIPGPPPLCGDCYYTYALTGICGGLSRWQVRLIYSSSPAQTRVTVGLVGGAGTMPYQEKVASGLQCHEVGSQSMTVGTLGWFQCGPSGGFSATVVV